MIEVKKVLLKDYAYVRDGVHAHKNWIKINEEFGRNGLIIKTFMSFLPRSVSLGTCILKS